MLASQRNGTLYLGSTDSLIVRMSQHQQQLRPGFTSKYSVDQLVWYEVHDNRTEAMKRERQMKKWRRAWKIELIERFNPGWRDLLPTLL